MGKITDEFWEMFDNARNALINDELRAFVGSDILADELEDALEMYASAIRAADNGSMPSDAEIEARRVSDRASLFAAMAYDYGRVMGDKRALCANLDKEGPFKKDAALNLLRNLAECQRTIVDYLAECDIERKKENWETLFGADFSDPKVQADFEITCKVIRGEF